ncbi:uncharacterized protein C11orf16 homolog [Clinocottus analis]|uniref:uncharacterized protein C11orf16 homolog n=1 Tax=Clinocottus analis TaxID=304258 RepID=UPI0035C075C0
MSCRRPAACDAALLALLLGGRRRNVTFVVDVSESASAALVAAKRLLIRTLLTKASLRDSLFNVVATSGQFTCWSRHMLPCAPDTVFMALSWIRSVSCGPGRGLPAALGAALADPACHAVQLLCAGVPDRPGAAAAGLPALAAGRPVNVFYLQDPGNRLDGEARDHLQCLTRATGGRCYVVPVGLNGALEKVIPLFDVEMTSSSAPVRCRCPSSSSIFIPHDMPSPLSLGNPHALSGQTALVPEFSPGCRVLARRQEDGLYHLGTVTQRVQGCAGLWVVEFDRPGGAGGSLEAAAPLRQTVCSLDMESNAAARTRPLQPGDAVLSPWEPDLRRYGPGRVMAAAAESTDGLGVVGVRSVQVLMWNRRVSLVPAGLVFLLSAPRHDRIVRELRMQTAASSRCCGWLGACSSSCAAPPPPLCCSVSNHRPCSFPPSWGRVEGTGRAEREKPPDLRDTDVWRSDPGVPSSSSSSSSSSSLSEDDSRALKLTGKQPRPPWRYWRQTGPEPQHRKPGGSVARTSSRPERFSFPSPQSAASANHSSLFLSLPGAGGRRANVRDVFEATDFKPRPPAGRRPFSAAAVYT